MAKSVGSELISLDVVCSVKLGGKPWDIKHFCEGWMTWCQKQSDSLAYTSKGTQLLWGTIAFTR